MILEKGGDAEWRYGHADNYAKVAVPRSQTNEAEMVLAHATGVECDAVRAEVVHVLATRRHELLPIL